MSWQYSARSSNSRFSVASLRMALSGWIERTHPAADHPPAPDEPVDPVPRPHQRGDRQRNRLHLQPELNAPAAQRHPGRQPDWPPDQRDEPELERRQPRQRRQVTQRVPRERGHHHQPEHHPLGAARPQPPREPLPHAGRRVPPDPGPPVATPEPERDQRSHHRAERAQQRARSETEKPTARDLERLAGNGPEHHLHRLGQHEPHRRGRAEARERLADRSLFQPQPAAQHQEGEEQEPSGDRDRMGREPTSSSSLRRLRPIAARSPHPAVAPSSPAPPLPSARLPTRTRARSPRIARAGIAPQATGLQTLPAPRPPRSPAQRTAPPPTTGAGRTGPPCSGSARSPPGPAPAPRL